MAEVVMKFILINFPNRVTLKNSTKPFNRESLPCSACVHAFPVIMFLHMLCNVLVIMIGVFHHVK